MKNKRAIWAKTKYLDFDTNMIMEQKSVNKNYGVYIYNFDFNQDVELELSFSEPTVLLQFVKKGNISFVPHKILAIGSRNYQCRLIYFPPLSKKILFTKGEYELIHFEINTPHVKLLSHTYTFLLPYLEYLNSNDENVHALNTISCPELFTYLNEMQQYPETHFKLRLRMEILIAHLISKYQMRLEEEKNSLHFIPDKFQIHSESRKSKTPVHANSIQFRSS